MLYQYYIGIGNWFIKTPFYGIEETEIEQTKTEYSFPRAEGISPQEMFNNHPDMACPADSGTEATNFG